MPIELPAGFLDDAKWTELGELAEGALAHMIDGGEVAEFTGAPMTKDEAAEYLRGFLERNEDTLREGGTDFLGGLARRIAQGDEPETSAEEFEASLQSLTDEQLAALTTAEADEVEAMKREVIDRRRALLADLLDTGKQVLRGAISSALLAVMGAS